MELQQRLQSALADTHRILRELGGGGMSRVFLAEEIRLGCQVVVKVLPPETGAAVNVERFEREIQLAARLQHPHIVPLLSAPAPVISSTTSCRSSRVNRSAASWRAKVSRRWWRRRGSCGRSWTRFPTPTGTASFIVT